MSNVDLENLVDMLAVKFGAGTSGDFDELDSLVRGAEHFTADLFMQGQAYACFFRSPHAHAHILSLDLSVASKIDGVIDIVSGNDVIQAELGLIPPLAVFEGSDGRAMFQACMPVLASDKVRYQGEPIALVIARTEVIAREAASAIRAEFEPLQAHTDPLAALHSDASLIHPECPNNFVLDWLDGDRSCNDMIDRSPLIATVTLHDPPIAACPMEPRSAIAQWDGKDNRYLLIAPTQGVMVLRKMLAESVFKIDASAIRVVTPQVGGGFGAKVQTYAEYAALLFASRRCGHAIKWVSSRSESFVSDTHGRNSHLQARMGFDEHGRALGIEVVSTVGIGAYTSTYVGIVATNNTKNCLSSVYRIPRYLMRSRLVLTNAVPLGPYRGAGRPEAIYMVESLMDQAASRLGIDRAEIRRINMISPAEMPYQAPNGQRYDSGNFPELLRQAMARARWNEFEMRRLESNRRGLLRGIGLCCFLEVAGGILEEPIDIRLSPKGEVELRTGAQSIGQGHRSVIPGLIAKMLQIPACRVRLIQGDSEQVPGLVPTVASRSMMMAGGAASLACDEVLARGKLWASHLLEAAVADIDYSDGSFKVIGTDRSMALLELPWRINQASSIPQGLPSTLNNVSRFVSPAMTYPNGCHICEVEIDPETGELFILTYVAVDDVGRILSSDIVEGQILGGVAQGIGQVIGEKLIYDKDGSLLNGSFMDYRIPRADDLPKVDLVHLEVPCTTNPLGVKGAGESGVAGALPALASAVQDALRSAGVGDYVDIPFTAEKLWRALSPSRLAAR